MKIEFCSTYIPKNNLSNSQRSFILKENENLNIFGLSGSGKTSYVNALLGIPSTLKGDILFNSKKINTFSHQDWTDLRKNEISFVLQNLQIFGNLDIDDNIQIVANLYSDIDYSKIHYIKNFLNLAPQNPRKAKNLSLGERQRLAICRSLIRPFSTLILDEPFSHLDKENTEKATLLINEVLKENNANVIFTSHSKSNWQILNKSLLV